MKKMLFFAAMAAVMASCTSEEPMMVSNGNGTAIGFDTYVGKATRAGDINTANLAKFYVYGGETATDFNGTEVTKTDAGWTYSPTQYWVKDSKYTFAAVAPTKTGSFDGTKLTVADYTPADDDLIVAVTNEITGKEAGSNAAVNINFKHSLSKVQVTFTGDLTKLTEAKLTGINNKATLSVTYGEEGTAPVWGDAVATGDYTYTVDATTGKGVKYLLPQTLTAAKIAFTYNGKPYDKELATTDVTAWEMGKAYNYNITLEDKDEISFTVTVAEWPTLGDEPAQTEPGNTETPEEPSDDPTEEPGDDDEVPASITLSEYEGTYIRSNATDKRYNTDDNPEIEIQNNDGTKFIGLMAFDLPANIKKNGYKTNVTLKLVTTMLKGDTEIDLYELTGTAYSEGPKWEKFGEPCEEIISSGTPVAQFTAKGKSGSAMKDIKTDDTENLDVNAWTNTVPISESIRNSIETSEEESRITFIITKRNAVNNQSIKFATKRVSTANDGKFSMGNMNCELSDLHPQLVISYEKE